MAFEIARRHRFLGDLASLPDDVEIHVMPTGQPEPPKYNDLSALRYRVVGGRGREHRPRAHRLAELPDGARAVRSPLAAPRARRPADPRHRVRAAGLRAVPGRRVGGAVAAVRRAPADPGARARAGLGEHPHRQRRRVRACSPAAATARTTASCAGSWARSRAPRCASPACASRFATPAAAEAVLKAREAPDDRAQHPLRRGRLAARAGPAAAPLPPQPADRHAPGALAGPADRHARQPAAEPLHRPARG